MYSHKTDLLRIIISHHDLTIINLFTTNVTILKSVNTMKRHQSHNNREGFGITAVKMHRSNKRVTDDLIAALNC